jgi:hypothetical protein
VTLTGRSDRRNIIAAYAPEENEEENRHAVFARNLLEKGFASTDKNFAALT